jgi:hypothetical protein
MAGAYKMRGILLSAAVVFSLTGLASHTMIAVKLIRASPSFVHGFNSDGRFFNQKIDSFGIGVSLVC